MRQGPNQQAQGTGGRAMLAVVAAVIAAGSLVLGLAATASRPGHGSTHAAVIAAGALVLGLASTARCEPETLMIDARSFQHGDAFVGAGWGEPLSIGGIWAEYDVEIASLTRCPAGNDCATSLSFSRTR